MLINQNRMFSLTFDRESICFSVHLTHPTQTYRCAIDTTVFCAATSGLGICQMGVYGLVRVQRVGALLDSRIHQYYVKQHNLILSTMC